MIIRGYSREGEKRRGGRAAGPAQIRALRSLVRNSRTGSSVPSHKCVGRRAVSRSQGPIRSTCRGAENRPRSTWSQTKRTTGILRPEPSHISTLSKGHTAIRICPLSCPLKIVFKGLLKKPAPSRPFFLVHNHADDVYLVFPLVS